MLGAQVLWPQILRTCPAGVLERAGWVTVWGHSLPFPAITQETGITEQLTFSF